VSLNGARVRHVVAGHFLVIDRRWRRGDRVQIDLDMSLHYWVGQRQCRGKVSIYRGPVLLTYDRRFNDMDLDDVPELDAKALRGRRVSTSRYSPRPMLLVQLPARSGQTLRLCDFASAGEAGSPYRSWLAVRNAPKASFSPTNPLRSGRPRDVVERAWNQSAWLRA